MSATNRIENILIKQNETFSETLERWFYPYEVHVAADGQTVLKADGTPAPAEERVLENYGGCTGVLDIYNESGALVASLSTAPGGGMILGGPSIQLTISDEDTDAMSGWSRGEGDIYITRPNGDTERHYELTFRFSPKAPRGGL